MLTFHGYVIRTEGLTSTPLPIFAPNIFSSQFLHPYMNCGDNPNSVPWTSHHHWTYQAGFPRNPGGVLKLLKSCTCANIGGTPLDSSYSSAAFSGQQRPHSKSPTPIRFPLNRPKRSICLSGQNVFAPFDSNALRILDHASLDVSTPFLCKYQAFTICEYPSVLPDTRPDLSPKCTPTIDLHPTSRPFAAALLEKSLSSIHPYNTSRSSKLKSRIAD